MWKVVRLKFWTHKCETHSISMRVGTAVGIPLNYVFASNSNVRVIILPIIMYKGFLKYIPFFLQNNIYLGQSCPWTSVCLEVWFGSLDKPPSTVNKHIMSRKSINTNCGTYSHQLKLYTDFIDVRGVHPWHFSQLYNICMSALSKVVWWSHEIWLMQ